MLQKRKNSLHFFIFFPHLILIFHAFEQLIVNTRGLRLVIYTKLIIHTKNSLQFPTIYHFHMGNLWQLY